VKTDRKSSQLTGEALVKGSMELLGKLPLASRVSSVTIRLIIVHTQPMRTLSV